MRAVILVFCMGVVMTVIADSVAGGVSLQEYRWQNRLLLVFAPEEDDPRLARQIAISREHGDGLAERDLLLMEVVGRKAMRIEGHAGSATDAQALRDRHDVASDEFAVILIGKDGGMKRREPRPFEAEDLFATIDAMPMRQREMRVR